jgi:hypothetical protein
MIGARELKRQIRDVLAELGSCRFEVAEALRNLGVHAVPKDPQDCAVAVYLKRSWAPTYELRQSSSIVAESRYSSTSPSGIARHIS